jgi:hypothetical protein
MAFRRFGTFRTPHGWLGTDGDGRIFQRGLKRGEPDNNVTVPDKPLQAYRSGDLIKVTSGTIGNKVPTINGTALSNSSAGFEIPEDNYYVLYAECPASNLGNVSFPSGVPTLTLAASLPNDTDTTGHIRIADINVYGSGVFVDISNYLSGSLWGERVKVTSSPAVYYFNLI